jgi:hypothetical protein
VTVHVCVITWQVSGSGGTSLQQLLSTLTGVLRCNIADLERWGANGTKMSLQIRGAPAVLKIMSADAVEIVAWLGDVTSCVAVRIAETAADTQQQQQQDWQQQQFY